MKKDVKILLFLAAFCLVALYILNAHFHFYSKPQNENINTEQRNSLADSENLSAQNNGEKSFEKNLVRVDKRDAEMKFTSSSDKPTSASENLVKIFGIVENESEQPIAEAELIAIQVVNPMRREYGEIAARGKSDSSGKYEIFVEKTSGYLILSKAKGYAATQNFVFGDRLNRGSEIELNIRMGIGVSISGIVKDESGKGIEGALVSPFFSRQNEREREGDDRGGPGREGMRRNERGAGAPGFGNIGFGNFMGDNRERGRGGFFANMIPPDFLAVSTNEKGEFVIVGLTEGIYSIAVKKDGYSPVVKDDIPAPSKGNEFILKKGDGCIIAGSVYLAMSGEPVEGATIKVRSYPFTMKTIEARSNKDGAFKIAGLIPGVFEISAEKGAQRSMPHPSIDLSENISKLDVVLRLFDGYTIEGKVFEQDGIKVIPNVTVTAREGFREEGKTAVTDENGFYSISGIFASSIFLNAALEGYFQMTNDNGPGGFMQVRMPADKALLKDVDITMIRGVKISGSVVSAYEDSPIAGAEVQFNTDSTGGFQAFRRQRVMTNVEGKFSGYVMSNSRVVLVASHKDYADSSSNPLTATDEDINDVVLKLGKGGTVKGIVITPDGEPVNGAVVFGSAQGATVSGGGGFGGRGGSRMGEQRVNTGADGKFTMEKVPAGSFSLSASADDYPNSNRVTVNVPEDAETEEVKLVLGTPHFIEGIVKQASGEPAVGATVSALRSSRQGGMRRPSQTMTGDKGNFRFDKLTEGKYTLTASNGGLKSKSVDTPCDVSGIELTLDVDETYLHGRVIDASTKKPVESFTLRASGGRRSYGEFNNPNGEFEIDSLTRGNSYRFLIESEGYVSTLSPEVKIPMEGAPADVTFELGAGGSIFGTVLFSENKTPVVGAKVTRVMREGGMSPQGREQTAFTNKDGCFLFEGQSPGKYLVKAVYGKYPEVSIEGTLINDSVLDVGTLILVNGGNVEGVIFNNANPAQPVANMMIRLNSVNLASPIEMTYRTGIDGRYVFENLRKASYMLTPIGQGYKEKKITIKSGQTITVNFKQSSN